MEPKIFLKLHMNSVDEACLVSLSQIECITAKADLLSIGKSDIHFIGGGELTVIEDVAQIETLLKKFKG